MISSAASLRRTAHCRRRAVSPSPPVSHSGRPTSRRYKANLQGWLQDAAFWTDMSAYVSDFSQENYADIRSYAVAGVPLPTRRDLLNDYLQHELRLPVTGPDTAAAARGYLLAAYSPLANAAWRWDFGFGWTMMAVDQMQDFVSAQTYALRYDGAARAARRTASGSPGPRGTRSAWRRSSPLRPQLLDRLAAAVRDSGLPVVAGDPGVGACGLPARTRGVSASWQGRRLATGGARSRVGAARPRVPDAAADDHGGRSDGADHASAPCRRAPVRDQRPADRDDEFELRRGCLRFRPKARGCRRWRSGARRRDDAAVVPLPGHSRGHVRADRGRARLPLGFPTGHRRGRPAPCADSGPARPTCLRGASALRERRDSFGNQRLPRARPGQSRRPRSARSRRPSARPRRSPPHRGRHGHGHRNACRRIRAH